MKTEDEIRAEFEATCNQGQRQAAFSEAFHAEMCSGGGSSGNYVDDAKEWFDTGWQTCQRLNDAVIAAKDEHYNSLDTVFEALKDTHDKLLDIARQQDAKIARLRKAINITLEENSNLADGDNCTLIHLKQALETTNE